MLVVPEGGRKGGREGKKERWARRVRKEEQNEMGGREGGREGPTVLRPPPRAATASLLVGDLHDSHQKAWPAAHKNPHGLREAELV